MVTSAGQDAVEAVPRNHGVNVIGRGVTKLDLFPEVSPAGPYDPGGIGIQYADIVGDSDDRLILEKIPDALVGGVDPGLVFLGASGRL